MNTPGENINTDDLRAYEPGTKVHATHEVASLKKLELSALKVAQLQKSGRSTVLQKLLKRAGIKTL